MTQKKRRRPKRRHWLQIEDDEWIQPVKRGFVNQCCDCALVHVTDFAIEAGKIQFKTRVDRRLTAAARRAFKFQPEKED